MSYHNRTYVILPIEELDNINFSEVMETSSTTVRKNNDGQMFGVKYEGAEPTSVANATKVTVDGREYHTHEEILEIMSTTGTTGWTVPMDI